MSEILLFHHTDKLVDVFPSNFSDRPMFLWYADRWCHFLGTDRYLYFFLVNPKRDGIELRSRSSTLDFDMMHKNALHYKGWREGTHPEWCGCERRNLRYEEAGIAMTFSEMKPTVTLMARSYGSRLSEYKQVKYEILSPLKPFSKRVIQLFEKPYEDNEDSIPIKFTDIPELVDLMPTLPEALNFQDLTPDAHGKFFYEDWVDISTHSPKSWWL